MFKKFIEKLYLSYSDNLVYKDILTNLHNRNYYELVIKEKYKNKSAILCLIDLNNLKKINDKRGHNIGDKILIELSTLLKENNFIKDSLRYGGDEFIIILNKNLLDTYSKCNKYIQSLLKKFTSITNESFSYGIINKNIEDSIDSVIQKADESLYKMKSKKELEN